MRNTNIDLGLAVMRLCAKPRTSYTCEEIAAFCDTTPWFISCIEKKALRKLRLRLEMMKLKSRGTPERLHPRTCL